MSSGLAIIIAEDRLLNYLVLSAQVICCYDYCLTFASEVTYMWSRKFSLPAVLFYAFRYPAMLNTLFSVLGYFPWRSWQSPHSCTIIIRFEMAGDVLILTSSGLFTALRIYALFHRSVRLSAFTLVLGLISPIISTYTFVVSQPILYEMTPGYSVCYIHNPYVTNLWMMGARASSLVFDGFVLGLTWRGTRRASWALGDSQRVLLNDTAVYFGFLSVLNVLGILIAAIHLPFIAVVSTWTAILTSVLLSRLMLDLRAAITNLPAGADSRARASRGRAATSLSRTLGSLVFSAGRVPPEDMALRLIGRRAGAESEQWGDGEDWTAEGADFDDIAPDDTGSDDTGSDDAGSDDASSGVAVVLELRDIRPV